MRCAFLEGGDLCRGGLKLPVASHISIVSGHVDVFPFPRHARSKIAVTIPSKMLGTWRLDTKNENSMFMRQAIDPVTARPVVQQACNSCRAKKVSHGFNCHSPWPLLRLPFAFPHHAVYHPCSKGPLDARLD
jgi:hypothetical protein